MCRNRTYLNIIKCNIIVVGVTVYIDKDIVVYLNNKYANYIRK